VFSDHFVGRPWSQAVMVFCVTLKL